ncbi:hypothetical protein Syun_029373 [Stephania yunnanensis]|uniref:Uncharacterized protein n=1 Tax=Stephania yunnanensis TaxID=152371 RepID=A0AAP0EDH7_9MAGN
MAYKRISQNRSNYQEHLAESQSKRLKELPGAEMDLLMVFASSRIFPSAPVFYIFADLAKSGRISFPVFNLMVAEYLGEENMLTVVCKSYAVAGSLECYDEESGRIDREPFGSCHSK